MFIIEYFYFIIRYAVQSNHRAKTIVMLKRSSCSSDRYAKAIVMLQRSLYSSDRHTGEGRYPAPARWNSECEVPAFAGMTIN